MSCTSFSFWAAVFFLCPRFLGIFLRALTFRYWCFFVFVRVQRTQSSRVFCFFVFCFLFLVFRFYGAVIVAAALRHGLSTLCEATGESGLERRVLAFFQSGVVPSEGLLSSFHLHTVAGFTQANWQLLSVGDQWLRSQAMPFIIGGDFQGEPEQLEGSGWVRAGRSLRRCATSQFL